METGNNGKIMEDLNVQIGNEELSTLKPAQVEIVGVNVVELKNKEGTKVIGKKATFQVQHPDSKDTIGISSVTYISKNQVKVSGTWFNLDKNGQLQKGSALAVLMQKAGAPTLAEMLNKKLDTVADDKGYLAFKAY
jgi:hypothetical protein